MKSFLTAAAFLAITVAMSATAATTPAPTPAAAAEPASKAHVLTRTEIDQLLKDPKKILFIDVRRPDELTAIGGFPVYLSIQFNDLKSSLAWIPKDRRIVAVSNHAARGGKAADLLAENGFDVIGAIGVQLYEKDGGKLTKISPPPPKPAAGT